MAVADVIKRHRKARGWTQQGLADLSGLTQGAITNLERGVNPRPSAETMQKLAHAFSVSADQLMAEAGLTPSVTVMVELKATVSDQALAELLRNWPDLTEEDRAAALSLVRSFAKRSKQRKNGKHQVQTPESEPAVS